MAAPKLEKHFTMRINLSPEHVYDLKAVRGHNRFIAAIAGGFIKGEGLEAKILPGGADWVSVCLYVYVPTWTEPILLLFRSLSFTHWMELPY